VSELILVWSLVVSASLSAPPEQKPLELGVYLPRLTLVTPEARNAHAEAVGDTLSKALDRPVHGRAFANVSDLDAFIAAGRLDLGLVDIAVLVARPTLAVLAQGTGPFGRSPAYAVMSRKSFRGINALEGRRLALPKVGPEEAKLLSNFALEGEADITRFFGRLHWSTELTDVAERLGSGRSEVTLAYAALAAPMKLQVAAPLRGMPLPVLVEMGSGLSDSERAALSAAVAKPLPIPAVGPLTHLTAPRGKPADALRRALGA